MKKQNYKITEVFPQSVVRLVHYIRATKNDLEEMKLEPGLYAYKTETEIDFGGEARTEDIKRVRA